MHQVALARGPHSNDWTEGRAVQVASPPGSERGLPSPDVRGAPSVPGINSFVSGIGREMGLLSVTEKQWSRWPPAPRQVP